MSKKIEKIKRIIKERGGQSLVEVLISIGMAAILLGSSVYIGRSVLRSNSDVKKTQAATNLAQELMDNARVYADANWSTFYNTSKGSANHYNIDSSGSTYVLASGDDVVTQNSVQFTRYFYAENVYRDSSSDAVSDSGGVLDTSTQKVTVKVFWEGKEGISISEYIARYRSYVFLQTDWSGGANQSLVNSLSSVGNLYSSASSVATGTAGQIKLDGY